MKKFKIFEQRPPIRPSRLMQTALQIGGNAVAAFGFVSVSMTLSTALLLRELLLSDNPYIMGWAVAIVIVPAVVLFLAVERFWGRRVGTLSYVGYFLLMSLPLLYGVFYGELHGPGIALMILVSMVIYAPIIFLLLRAPAIQRWLAAGWTMAVVFLVGLGATYYAVYAAFRGS